MVVTFLLVVLILVALAMVGVILMQRSEGGGLGMGGSPAGLMSARGAADFLTRATSILAAIFIGLSITLAVLVSATRTAQTKYVAPAPTATPAAPLNKPAPNADPLAPSADPLAPAAPAANSAAPAAPKK